MDRLLEVASVHREQLADSLQRRAAEQWAREHAAIVCAVTALYSFGARGRGVGVSSTRLDASVHRALPQPEASASGSAPLVSLSSDQAARVLRHRAGLSKCFKFGEILEWTNDWRSLIETAERDFLDRRCVGVSSIAEWRDRRVWWRLKRTSHISDPLVLTSALADALLSMQWRRDDDRGIVSPDGVPFERNAVISSSATSCAAGQAHRITTFWFGWQALFVAWGVERWISHWISAWSLLFAVEQVAGLPVGGTIEEILASLEKPPRDSSAISAK